MKCVSIGVAGKKQHSLQRAIFGNDYGPPVKSGLPSKAEGPASGSTASRTTLRLHLAARAQRRGDLGKRGRCPPCPAASYTPTGPAHHTFRSQRPRQKSTPGSAGSKARVSAQWGERGSAPYWDQRPSANQHPGPADAPGVCKWATRWEGPTQERSVPSRPRWRSARVPQRSRSFCNRFGELARARRGHGALFTRHGPCCAGRPADSQWARWLAQVLPSGAGWTIAPVEVATTVPPV